MDSRRELTYAYAFGGLLTAALLSFLGIRRYFYEIFLRLHLAMTGVGTIALWRHLSIQRVRARLYVLGGITLWGCLLVLSFFVDCYHNINLGRSHWLPRVNIVKVYQATSDDQVVMADACLLEIQVNRCWDVRPGHYHFICLPALGFLSIFQSHPFWVVWWEKDSKTGTMQLDMLVRKRRGFTRRLLSHTHKEYTGWISRPFGQSEAFGDYGSVLMFATDIGIAAHLPYLKIFMQGRTEASIRTRRVVVVWQVKDRSRFPYWNFVLPY